MISMIQKSEEQREQMKNKFALTDVLYVHHKKLKLIFLNFNLFCIFFFLSLFTDQHIYAEKIFDGGTQNFRSPSVPNGDEAGWGGLAKKSDWSQNGPLMQN